MTRVQFVCLCLILQSCQPRFEYKVVGVCDDPISVDGRMDEKCWPGAKALTGFSNPWHKEVAPETSLRMSRDSLNLYFFFEAADREIVWEPALSGERGVEQEDRVELFFSKDMDMGEYYCLEIDALGRVLSYRARHYRQLDFSWETPPGFKVAANMDTLGYTVEGAIPLSFLRSLSENGVCYFGAYRAEFSRNSAGLSEEWLTWKNPGTEEPDFHVPATLGKLVW